MRFFLPVCALAVLATATACTSTSTAASPIATATTSTTATGPRGSVSVGDIKISNAYIPQPASPDVAAAYFTVTDVGAKGDVLLSATSDPSSQASLMQESETGADAGTMANISGGLSIPADGAVELGPGGYHLMLTNPAATLTAGETVVLRLRFKTTGTVTLKVPVTSLLSDAQTSSMPGM
ncbi:copper chaperone PCu(A)C [Actinospica sp.]|jgi:copper(I)-binding protein|uniref:copper chaperone PCu(A)C n=1 Tax=Actinospica sp. TaxID=1872142 RepID=UPI002B98FEEC|nr:copper chaperone PCu(A)C [Actinospica sp.]HWG23904.1 copper chaperone PCu(A)C [Actinospica sp.]